MAPIKIFKAAVRRVIQNKNIPDKLINKETQVEASQEVKYFQLASELGITPSELKKKPYSQVNKWAIILKEINDYRGSQWD